MAEDGWVVCRVFKKKNFQKAVESPKTSSISLDSNTHQILASRNDGVLDQIILYMGRNNCKPENESFGNNISISDNSTTTSNNMMFLTAKHIDEGLHDRFLHLPRLESPTLPSLPIYQSFDHHDQMVTDTQPSSFTNHASGGNEDKTKLVDDDHHHDHHEANWVAFDRMVASQLNGAEEAEETAQQLSCFNDPNNMAFCPPDHDDVQFSDIRLSRQSQISHVYNTSENDIWSFTKSSSSPISSSSDPLSHLSV